jgi:predicted transcriptional regulator
MAKLDSSDGRRTLVVDDGEVVGIITPSDVTRWLNRRRAFGPGQP